MDTFMDKLAQKLTAQEMIQANTAADTKEMNRLKAQLEEYNKCLEKLQRLIEDGSTKLSQAKVDGGEINRLVEESIAKIQEFEQDAALLKELKESLQGYLNERLENTDENMHKECVKVYRNVQAVVVEESGKQKDSLENMEGVLSRLQGKLGAVFGISIASLILALAALMVQILSVLQVF